MKNQSSSSTAAAAATIKKRGREFNKDKDTGKSPRMECIVCHKPAVKYYHKYYSKDGTLTKREMIYEHRDEPPIKVYMYRGSKHQTYRRCNAGIVTEGLPLVEEKSEKIVEDQQQQQQQRPRGRPKQQEQSDYEKKYVTLTERLAEILYSAETPEQAAKRKINAILELMKDRKQHEIPEHPKQNV